MCTTCSHGRTRNPCPCLMPAEHVQSVSGSMALVLGQSRQGAQQFGGGEACLLGGGLLVLMRLAVLREESERRSCAPCAGAAFGTPGDSPCSSSVSSMPSSARTLCEEASASGSSSGVCRRACTSSTSALPSSWLLAACEAWRSCHLRTCTWIFMHPCTACCKCQAMRHRSMHRGESRETGQPTWQLASVTAGLLCVMLLMGMPCEDAPARFPEASAGEL